MCKCIPIILILGLAGGLTYYFLTKNKVIPNQLNIDWPTLEDFHREAPWNATDPSGAQRWENGGQGLSLTVLNALDSSWYTYFEAAIADWESGLDGIDPLTLSTKVVTQETECTPETGFQKVCNGDYGETGWNGINTILTSGSDLIIQSSAARMNEYYLAHGSDALRQYTMCHELGHGFGLPHTDESFWNRDLGNCMDYTMNPAGNMHPDLGNFEFLEELYGNTNGTGGGGGTTNVGDDAAVEPQSSSTSSGMNRQNAGDGEGSGYGVPEWVKEAWDSVSSEFVNYGANTAPEDNGWRLLRSHGNLRSHQIDIGQGYKITVNVLLADGYEDRLRN